MIVINIYYSLDLLQIQVSTLAFQLLDIHNPFIKNLCLSIYFQEALFEIIWILLLGLLKWGSKRIRTFILFYLHK
jgi:hypothetical protein